MSSERDELMDDMAEDAYERARQQVAIWETESGEGPLFPAGSIGLAGLTAFEAGIKAGFIGTLEMLTERGHLLWDEDDE